MESAPAAPFDDARQALRLADFWKETFLLRQLIDLIRLLSFQP
jgi:hypothetical protein